MVKRFSYNRAFPTPSFLSFSSAGIDFSDQWLRFIELSSGRAGLRLRRFAETAMPEGLVNAGRVVDADRFVSFLSDFRKAHGLRYVRVPVPESHTYSFITTVTSDRPKEIQSIIRQELEENIPIKAVEAVFDFAVLAREGKELSVLVIAAPEQLIASYEDVLGRAGLIPVSFELEAEAIARAAVPLEAEGQSYLLVDIGAKETGISVVVNRLPMFSATLELGGAMLTQMVSKETGVSFEEAEDMKKRYGLSMPEGDKRQFFALLNGLSSIKDEISRHYIHWRTKREESAHLPTISSVILCGGDANLKGFPEYLSTSLKLPVALANPWQNLFSLDEVVPGLSFQQSMRYLTAIGLALGNYDYD